MASLGAMVMLVNQFDIAVSNVKRSTGQSTNEPLSNGRLNYVLKFYLDLDNPPREAIWVTAQSVSVSCHTRSI